MTLLRKESQPQSQMQWLQPSKNKAQCLGKQPSGHFLPDERKWRRYIKIARSPMLF